MNTISIREIILSKRPSFLSSFPSFIRNILFYLIEKIIHQKEMNGFIQAHSDKLNISFIDEVLEYLDVSFQVSAKDRSKIPSEGKFIISANHPLGGLDGLILLKMIFEIRPDVKIVVNDILMWLDNLKDLFIPFDVTNGKLKRENIDLIGKSLNNGEAVLLFPSGEVSRFSLKGIKDIKWNKGAIFFAEKYNAPVLPVYVHGRNSLLFYFLSAINKRLSSFLLPHELFNKKSKIVTIKVGDYIPASSFSSNIYKKKYQIDLLRKHVYLLPKGKKVYKTEKNVVHPVEKKTLKKQIYTSHFLDVTDDGKIVAEADFSGCPDVIKEIARLREITFRKVGEGTGNKLDIDKFDKDYKHILLWDEKELEIAGAYRLGVCKSIIEKNGLPGLYTNSLFSFSQQFLNLLPNSIELGRSFIQSRYWTTNALDYLWRGIGKFIQNNPGIRYMFGGASISSSYSDEAKSLIVFFYNKWFGKPGFVQARNKYVISVGIEKEMKNCFNSDNYKSELITLKNRLKFLGYSIPTFYKQYSDLCEKDGVSFLDFAVDTNFNNCVDGLILIDITKIKASKKGRYLAENEKFNQRNPLQTQYIVSNL
jgi:putative hemolysin